MYVMWAWSPEIARVGLQKKVHRPPTIGSIFSEFSERKELQHKEVSGEAVKVCINLLLRF